MSTPEDNATVQTNLEDSEPTNRLTASGCGCSSLIVICCMLTFVPSIYRELNNPYHQAGQWLAVNLGLGEAADLIVPLIFFCIALFAIFMPFKIISGLNVTEATSKHLFNFLTLIGGLFLMFGVILLILLAMEFLNFVSEYWSAFMDWLFS